jgi:hypothetical protein
LNRGWFRDDLIDPCEGGRLLLEACYEVLEVLRSADRIDSNAFSIVQDMASNLMLPRETPHCRAEPDPLNLTADPNHDRDKF